MCGLVSGSLLFSVQIDVFGLRQFWPNFYMLCLSRKGPSVQSKIGKITKQLSMII